MARKLSGAVQLVRLPVKLRRRGANPVGGADRPAVSRDHSATVGLTPPEVDALLAAADADTGPAAAAQPGGGRAAWPIWACASASWSAWTSTDLGYERGHRSVRFVGKGGKPAPPGPHPGQRAAVEAYLRSGRAAGPRTS